MNHKKANWLFITFFLLEVITILGLYIGSRFVEIQIGLAANLILTESFFWIPCILFLIGTKTNPITFMRFKKIKIKTVFKIVLFTSLTLPITSFINSLTMLFTDNAVLEISDSMLEMPFLISFLLIAVYGPFVEEISFRGMLFHGYKKTGSTLKAIFLSSFLFGLAHLNINQFAYALVVGLCMAFLVEATGSIWSSILFHVIFNGYSVINLYLSENMLTEDYLNEAQAMFQQSDTMLLIISSLAVMTMICVPLLICVLVWIAKGENRTNVLQSLTTEFKENKNRLVSIPLILTILVCIGIMIFYI